MSFGYSLKSGVGIVEHPFVIYGRPDCEDTVQAREFLDERGVTYEYLNINEDPEAERFVILYNSGKRITPTIVMGPEDDRLVLVEPSNEELDAALNVLGYEDPRQPRF